jgi:hypothetical protein
MVKQYKYSQRTVKAKDIVFSSLNPSIRTERIGPLAKSIVKAGLITPVLVTEKLKLIDGHRRLTAIKSLDPEAKLVVSIVHGVNSKKQYEELFMHTNDGVMKMNPSQELEIYLNGGKNRISKRTLDCILNLRSIGGINLLKRISREQKSPFTYHATINMYMKYTKKKTKIELRKLLYWVFNVGSAYSIKSAMAFMIPSEVIVDAVHNRKPLSLISDNDNQTEKETRDVN